MTLFGDHEMDLETIEVPSLAGLITAPFFASIQATARDVVVVADCHQKAVDGVDQALIQFFPGLYQHPKQGQEEFTDAMQTTNEAAFSQPPENITIFHQETLCCLEIANEVKYGCDGSGHDFGIADLRNGKGLSKGRRTDNKLLQFGCPCVPPFSFDLLTENFTRNAWIFHLICPRWQLGLINLILLTNAFSFGTLALVSATQSTAPMFVLIDMLSLNRFRLGLVSVKSNNLPYRTQMGLCFGTTIGVLLLNLGH